jgi:hypothetical protein
MPWKPEFPGEFPTLGWYVLDWMSEYLATPDRTEYEPLTLTNEQARFVLDFYRIDPETGRRRYRRALWSRPKGHGKSPLLAAIALAEALADVHPDGWDANGRPVGKPWAQIRTPLVQVAAVTEDQTRNSWVPMLEMAREGPLTAEYPGIHPMETFIALPKGRIEFVTASASSLEGARPIFAIMDQTEQWKPGNRGVKLADVIRRNVGKVNGHTIESPNAFVPGEGSVAENSARFAQQIAEGRTKGGRDFLYDHVEAPADTDLSDRESLLHGLRIAYGDSAIEAGGWVDLDRIVAEIWDPDTDPQDARRYYLNQITHASDSFLSQPEWNSCRDTGKVVERGEKITLGFDGSRGRAKGKPDATALIGCRVSDGHIFQIGVWEAPDQQETWADWTPPIPEIEAALADAFKRYRVIGAYMDPAKDWRSYVNAWEAKYSAKCPIKVSASHPFEWWMTGGRSGLNQRAIEVFEGAVRNGDLSHAGEYKLTQHMLNARRRIVAAKLTLGKENDYSPNKIDAAVAAVLAWQARMDAVARGHGARTTGHVRRVR